MFVSRCGGGESGHPESLSLQKPSDLPVHRFQKLKHLFQLPINRAPVAIYTLYTTQVFLLVGKNPRSHGVIAYVVSRGDMIG